MRNSQNIFNKLHKIKDFAADQKNDILYSSLEKDTSFSQKLYFVQRVML